MFRIFPNPSPVLQLRGVEYIFIIFGKMIEKPNLALQILLNVYCSTELQPA